MRAFAISSHAGSNTGSHTGLAYASFLRNPKNPKGAGAAVMVFMAAAISLFCSSCTTIPREVSTRGLFDQFERTPQVLMRVEGIFLRDMVSSLDDSTIQAFLMKMNPEAPEEQVRKPINRARIDSTLSRTHAAAIGLTWNESSRISFEATLAGNFARLPTALSFALDSSWKRIHGGYAAKNGAIHVRDPQAGKLHISSFPFQTAESGAAPGSGIAGGAGTRALADQSGLSVSNASLDMYIDASSALVSKLPILDGITLPFDGIRFIAMRDERSPAQGSADAIYQVRFRMQMKDEQSARTFRPIMKLAWALLSAQISSMGLPVPPETGIEQKAGTFETQSFPVRAREIVKILKTMAEMTGAMPPQMVTLREQCFSHASRMLLYGCQSTRPAGAGCALAYAAMRSASRPGTGKEGSVKAA